jgi:hypothetical protein
MSEQTPTNDKRLNDDLIIGLIFKGDSVLYIKAGKQKNFPDFKMAHNTTDAQKAEQLKRYLRDDLGLTAASVELLGHIQKDPRDIMQYFINAHIYIYRVTLDATQPVTPPSDKFEFAFHDNTNGDQDGFSYKGKLMLAFLRDWTIQDFQRLDATDVRGWYNTWLAKHLKSAYQEYVDLEVDECRTAAEDFTCSIDQVVKQGAGVAAEARCANEVETVFQDSRQLADLIANTAEELSLVAPAPAPGTPPANPELQLAALNKIKDHLCFKLYGLKQSHLNERETRVAYRLMGHLLKRTNDLLDKYTADGAQPGYDFELKTLVYELESESLSPFDKRRG